MVSNRMIIFTSKCESNEIGNGNQWRINSSNRSATYHFLIGIRYNICSRITLCMVMVVILFYNLSILKSKKFDHIFTIVATQAIFVMDIMYVHVMYPSFTFICISLMCIKKKLIKKIQMHRRNQVLKNLMSYPCTEQWRPNKRKEMNFKLDRFNVLLYFNQYLYVYGQ